jgi:hypothetical protein
MVVVVVKEGVHEIDCYYLMVVDLVVADHLVLKTFYHLDIVEVDHFDDHLQVVDDQILVEVVLYQILVVVDQTFAYQGVVVDWEVHDHHTAVDVMVVVHEKEDDYNLLMIHVLEMIVMVVDIGDEYQTEGDHDNW